VTSPSPTIVAPPARYGASMGYDPVRRRVVLFGGRSGDQLFFSDTWLWDGHAWSEAHPAHHPDQVDQGFQMAFDAARSVLVMQQVSNTWTWNGNEWTLALTHTPFFSSGVAYDSDRKLVIAQNEQASYAWDGKAWHTSRQPMLGSLSRVQGPLAYDADHHAVLMFGGGVGGWGVHSPYSDTWLMKAGVWTQARPSTSPPGAYLNQLVYDEHRQMVIDYGGEAPADGLGPFNQVWAWTGADWQLLSSNGPPPMSQVAAAFDAEHHELVVFGGFTNSSSDPSSTTWTWDGSTWTKRASA
jgi:hypothetical protein